MTLDRASSGSPQGVSPALTELLDIIGSHTKAARNEALLGDELVAFKKRAGTHLKVVDLTLAFQKCFFEYSPASLSGKAIIVDWLSDLVRFTSPGMKDLESIVQELESVSKNLQLSRQQTEFWMSLLTGLCDLTVACVERIAEFKDEPIKPFLKNSGCRLLAGLVFTTGTRAFKHADRSSNVKEAKTEGYKSWLASNTKLAQGFLEFYADRIQQQPELKALTRDLTVEICNTLINFAEEARAEFAVLNLAYKYLIKLISDCVDTRTIRLEKHNMIRTVCNSATRNLAILISTDSHADPNWSKKPFVLARFYTSHLISMIKTFARDLCLPSEEAANSRAVLKSYLFFLRSRVLWSHDLKRKSPALHTQITAALGPAEEIVITHMLEPATISDEERLATIHDFTMASGFLTAVSQERPLTDHECNLGRISVLLKFLANFDSFSVGLQQLLYPPDQSSVNSSLVLRLVEAVNRLGMQKFVPSAKVAAGQEQDDLYFCILSDLCVFAFLVQPRQFARLQVDIVGLVLGRSEIWSLLAMDWWVCVSGRLGQSFTTKQVIVFLEMLASLPFGHASQKLANLIRSIMPTLDSDSKRVIVARIQNMVNEDAYAPLSSFPFECLSGPELLPLVETCTTGWSKTCELLSNEHLVVDTFYSMHQYVSCLASILRVDSLRTSLSENTRDIMILWSVSILGGVQELYTMFIEDSIACGKISRTVNDIVTFLTCIQPIQLSDLIQVLNTITLWENFPRDRQPLSRLTLATFLSTCSKVSTPDATQMNNLGSLLEYLYGSLLADTEWTVLHGTLMSVILFSENAPRPDIAEALIPTAIQQSALQLQEVESHPSDAPTEEDRVFWENVALALGRQQTRSLFRPETTVLDLQSMAGKASTAQECISDVLAAQRHVLVLKRSGKADEAFKERLRDELDKLQKLVAT